MTDHVTDHVTDQGEDHEEHPTGTWALLGIYLLVVVVMWVWVYALLIARG